ncbi:MAG: MFS transporter [Nitrososphaerota archaeon]|nr:MFS transporter [Nitrososphaerota archaeon]
MRSGTAEIRLTPGQGNGAETKGGNTVQEIAQTRKGLFALIVAVTVLPIFLEGFDGQLFFFDAPYIMHSVGVSPAFIGVAASGFAVGILVFSFLGGYLFDRYSAKTAVIISVAIFSLFTALTGYVTNLTEVIIYRILVGLGAGLFQTAILSFLGDIKFSWRAKMVGLFAIFFGVGLAVAPGVGAAFLPSFSTAFLISGVLGLISLILFLVFVPKTFKRREERKARLSSQMSLNLVLLMLAVFAFGIAFFAFESYISDYLLRGLSFSAGAAATAITMIGVGTIIASEIAGFASDKYGRKIVLISGSIALIASSAMMFGVTVGVAAAAALAFLFGAGYASFVANITAAAQDSVDEAWVGSATGMVFTTYNLGTILGGPLLGIALASGFKMAGLSIITIPSIAALLLVSVLRLKSVPKQAP